VLSSHHSPRRRRKEEEGKTADEVLILGTGKSHLSQTSSRKRPRQSQVTSSWKHWPPRNTLRDARGPWLAEMTRFSQRPHQGGYAGERRNQGGVPKSRRKRRADSQMNHGAIRGRDTFSCDGHKRERRMPYISRRYNPYTGLSRRDGRVFFFCSTVMPSPDCSKGPRFSLFLWSSLVQILFFAGYIFMPQNKQAQLLALSCRRFFFSRWNGKID